VSDIRVVLLPVGADLYAVPIEWVREVVAAPALTGLVTAPVLVLGLMNLRGEIVPLLDTAALLGVGTVGGAAFAAVLHTPQGPAALAATGLPGRASLGSPAGPSELPGTAGVFQLEQGVAVLLDPAALLASERLGSDELRAAPKLAAVV
jgi:chemotaxis signal transduction protein